MKTLVALILLSCTLGLKAQTIPDTTYTPTGKDIDYPFLYVRIDSIHGLSYLYNHYPHKMLFSVNGAKAVELKRGEVVTVWSNHFIVTVTVTRKKYKHLYQF